MSQDLKHKVFDGFWIESVEEKHLSIRGSRNEFKLKII